ncbi:MAG: F0F1 ATP synthase subunit epsilon [Armatimonadetes bacterium]|nr:F0F1 ATP synthase subunit epsilon [Armatimonadota bacterium]
MAGTFMLEIVTPERRVFGEEIEAVMVPGVEGYLGVMARHAPMVAELAVGQVKITHPGGKVEFLAIDSGFMEVANNKAIILADSAERAVEIDVARAEAARARARQRLSSHESDVDLDRARASLSRALNRLSVAGGDSVGR